MGLLFAGGAGLSREAFPVVGEEFVDAAVRVGGDAAEQVTQVDEGGGGVAS